MACSPRAEFERLASKQVEAKPTWLVWIALHLISKLYNSKEVKVKDKTLFSLFNLSNHKATPSTFYLIYSSNLIPLKIQRGFKD